MAGAEVRSVLLVVAMEQEAAPIIEHFALQKLAEPGFLPGAPMVAWEGTAGCLTLRLVWNGRDQRFSANNVGTAAAAVATYAAFAALGPHDLVLSVGTAGGFAERGAAIGDIYPSRPSASSTRGASPRRGLPTSWRNTASGTTAPHPSPASRRPRYVPREV